MAATYLNDAGTWRKLKDIYVNDAGTWRRIRYVYVNDAGTWRTVFTAQDDLSIVAGHSAPGGGIDGYSTSSPVIGSITGGTLGDGMIVTRITTQLDGDLIPFLVLKISGFSDDPGIGYLTSIDPSVFSVLSGAAASYSYVGGVATWQWDNLSSQYVNGQTYPIIVVRA